MRRAERVVHVAVHGCGQRLGKFAIVSLFPCVKPQVFKQDDTARTHLPKRRLHGLADAVFREDHRPVE